ncbi:MAG: glycerol-3-phosphate 1-O-acyltransferase PlsY [Pseudomonadota bacterium]|nr:glycerol-3-phosphate 1-O-acyltransferase PlsY [Pseudomonadota bacterium]
MPSLRKPADVSLLPLFLAAAAYLIGSISFAVVVSRLYGLPDPRTFGSRNPGATNMLRGGNRMAALWTLVGDTLKGVVAVALARALLPADAAPEAWLALCALAVFLGHLFPLFFGFTGGKGVATAAGILVTLYWPLGLGTLLAWLAVFALTRVSSMAALSAAAAAPVLAWGWLGAGPLSAAVTVMSALLIWRHRSNIRKLLSGEEAAFRRR